MNLSRARYWDQIAEAYHRETVISTDDFHYGPLVPGDRELKLLPSDLRACRALELGCGGAENSLYLARQGAVCTALDISARQLDVARKRLAESCCEVTLVRAAMEQVECHVHELYDLIHSSYAFPFSADPRAVLQACGRLLKPGGCLLFSTSHPLAAGEWLELDDDGEGLWLADYFSPPDDVRVLGDLEERAAHYPISTWFTWVREAGLEVTALLEPAAADPAERAPYFSEAWLEQYNRLAHIPFVAIFQCRKPLP